MPEQIPDYLIKGYEAAAAYIATKPAALIGCNCPQCTFILKWKEIHNVRTQP